MKMTKKQMRRIINEAMSSDMAKTIRDLGDHAAGGYSPKFDGSPEQYASEIIQFYQTDDVPAPLNMPRFQEALSKYPDLVEEETVEAIRALLKRFPMLEAHGMSKSDLIPDTGIIPAKCFFKRPLNYFYFTRVLFLNPCTRGLMEY